MKIVMTEKGEIVARHADAAVIDPKQYSEHGPVLIGSVPDSVLRLATKPSEIDRVDGSVIDIARDLARQMVRRHIDKMMADLTADYPQAERDSWSAKLAEAKAVLADENAETVYLAAVAEASGGKVGAIAKSVIKKAEAYAEALASAEATRSRLYAAIDKAKNVSAVIAAVADIG